MAGGIHGLEQDMGSSIDKSSGTPFAARKPYQKPLVTRIELDARCAVLGFCKKDGVAGPQSIGCEDGFSDPCNAAGS